MAADRMITLSIRVSADEAISTFTKLSALASEFSTSQENVTVSSYAYDEEVDN